MQRTTPIHPIEVTPQQLIGIFVAAIAITIGTYEIVSRSDHAVWAVMSAAFVLAGGAIFSTVATNALNSSRHNRDLAELLAKVERIGGEVEDVRAYDREILEAIRSLLPKRRGGDSGPNPIYRVK